MIVPALIRGDNPNISIHAPDEHDRGFADVVGLECVVLQGERRIVAAGRTALVARERLDVGACREDSQILPYESFVDFLDPWTPRKKRCLRAVAFREKAEVIDAAVQHGKALDAARQDEYVHGNIGSAVAVEVTSHVEGVLAQVEN